ncbi:MAG: hypothetical protein M4579_000304 [Chaenotheca gracillima]|nr:MAG: hypothetical protein M4579_000304 [Chaenotheca gracillima]
MTITLCLLVWSVAYLQLFAGATSAGQKSGLGTPSLPSRAKRAGGLLPRRLNALKRRSLEVRAPFNLYEDHEFHYAEEALVSTDDQFVARVETKSHHPMLSLESLEAYLEDVTCSGSAITLRFTEEVHLRTAVESWTDASSFAVVTSHSGCDDHGERSAYHVSSFEHFDNVTLVLSADRQSWRSACHSIKVDFGTASELFGVDSLQRRQNDPASASLAISSTRTSVVPSSAATNTVIENLSHSLINQQILPPDIPVLNQVIPQGATISCKNCTLAGSLEITKGSLTIDGSTSNSTDDIMSLFESGSIEVTAHDMSAYMLLELSLQPSVAIKSFSASLPPIPITPVVIPGIAEIGPELNLAIPMGVTLGASINFTSGIDVTVPDGSFVILDLANVTKSTYHGFDETKVTTLPLEASDGDISLTFFMGFRPELDLAITALDGQVTASAGVFLDLPKLSLKVEQVTSVDRNCEPISSSNKLNTELQHLVGNLTHLVPSVELGIGVSAHAEFFVYDDVASATILTTTFPLPTECLAFDKKSLTFGPVPDPTPTIKAPAHKGIAAAIANPFEGAHQGFAELQLSCAALSIVSIVFLLL